MSYLASVKDLRNRMLACNKSASVSVNFLDDDMVLLCWEFDNGFKYNVKLCIEQLSINNRVYEREMHKAKRAMRKAV